MSRKITSLESLIQQLEETDQEEHKKIISAMDIPKSEFVAYAHWKKSGYARNCIKRTKDYELLLLCWNPGDRTPVHGHDGQDCWVYLVDGEMTEIRYKADEDDNLTKTHTEKLTGHRLTYMRDEMGYHMIKNNSEQRAMTLHIYALPIDECEVFDEKNETFVDKEMKYDTVMKERIAF
jgi:cysteine dioxygenase